jgi:hypothetical protein
VPNTKIFFCATLLLIVGTGCSNDPTGPQISRDEVDVGTDLSVESETDFGTDIMIDAEILVPDAAVDAGCQPTAMAEVACDGIDDDCDGIVDEALMQRCYDGPGGSLGNGRCSAGNQTCEDGAWTECTDQILPSQELCNAFDDDCDGTVDEALLEFCDEDAVAGVGQCRPPARICSDGAFGECSPAIEPVEEACDGLDNDCDGANDELFPDGDMDLIADCVDDDFDNDGITNALDNCPDIANDTQRDTDEDMVGDACDDDDDGDGTPDGDDCGPLDPVRFPGSVETCNGLDDDCDTQIDEVAEQPCFDGDESLIGVGRCAEGVQSCLDGEWGTCQNAILPSIETCDGQDQDCDGDVDEGLQPGWPDEDEDQFGDDSRRPVCPAPQNYAVVPGDCDDSSRDVYPGAPDVPDQLYRDENCDGTDGTASEMIFVADVDPDYDGTTVGTREQPFLTLREAIDTAAEQGIKYVAISNAAPLNGPLVDGVSLIGGYSLEEGWRRDELRKSLTYTDRRDVPTNVGVRIEDFEQPIILANLSVRPGRPEPGETSYGIFVKNAVSVTIYNTNVDVAAGGDGLNGSLGTAGLSAGGAGGGAKCGDGGDGGVGGVSMCGDGGRGGNGGRGSNDDGQTGQPENCAGGGGSGANSTETGGSGGTGAAGEDGAWGSLGAPALEPHPSADGWFTGFGSAGGVGDNGTAGCGGGGGGGAWWYPNQHGGGGGGGGGAGCGGLGATGGRDGGASIGIFLANAGEVLLDNVFVRTSNGGLGGPGGTGGQGGLGGDGGAGSSGDDWPCNVGLGPGYGGPGGRGGNGGRGGDGIGGRGGWAVGITCFETIPDLIDVVVVPGEVGDPLGTNVPGQSHSIYECE